MLKNVIPYLQKDHGEGGSFIQDPMKAAVIMLFVYKQFAIKLSNAELCRLCTLLCLPKKDKEDFLHYWTQFSQDISILPKLVHFLSYLVIL